MSIFAIFAQLLFGPEIGPCEVCGEQGKKQQSIVDPGSPSLKILCPNHWKQFTCGNKCSYCGATPTYHPSLSIFLCKDCVSKNS